jgi:hypothetical protein
MATPQHPTGKPPAPPPAVLAGIAPPPPPPAGPPEPSPATSTTRLRTGTGSKTLEIQAGKPFQVDQWVLIQARIDADNQMRGVVDSYVGTTLVVDVTLAQGSEMYADWTVVQTDPPPPKRQIRPLRASQIKLTEHAVHQYEITLEKGQLFEDVMRTDFYQNIGLGGEYGMRPGDRIFVHAADRTFAAELYVLDVVMSKPVAGIKGGAVVAVWAYREFDRAAVKPRQQTHTIRFAGPTVGYVIDRLNDGKQIAQFTNEEGAQRHLAGMVRTGMA